MYSLRNFTLKRWLAYAAFLFSITFFAAYFTGWTSESKHFLKSKNSLMRRAFTSLAVGLVISFYRVEEKE